MPVTNHERVGKGLALLKKGLAPFVERELQAVYGGDWRARAAGAVVEEKVKRDILAARVEWDAQALLVVMWSTWNDVFKRVLGQSPSRYRSAHASAGTR